MGFDWTHSTKSTLAFLVVFGAILVTAGIITMAIPGLESVSLWLRIFGSLLFGVGFFFWLFRYMLHIIP